MLEEIKTNTINLFISNSMQLETYSSSNSSNQKANAELSSNANENSFTGLINNLKSRQEKNPQEIKKTNSYSADQPKISFREIVNSTKKISSELENEITECSQEENSSKLSDQKPVLHEKTKKSKDQEVNYLVLSEMKQHVSRDIENISQAIAKLDLNTADGINEIIQLSDKLEILNQLESLINTKLEAIDLPLDQQLSLEDIELDIKEFDGSIKKLDLAFESFDKKNLSNYIAKQISQITEAKSLQLNSENSAQTQLNSTLDQIKNLENNIKSIKDLSQSASIDGKANPNINLESTQEARVKEITIKPESTNPTLSKNLLEQDRLIMLENLSSNQTNKIEKKPENLNLIKESINNTKLMSKDSQLSINPAQSSPTATTEPIQAQSSSPTTTEPTKTQSSSPTTTEPVQAQSSPLETTQLTQAQSSSTETTQLTQAQSSPPETTQLTQAQSSSSTTTEPGLTKQTQAKVTLQVSPRPKPQTNIDEKIRFSQDLKIEDNNSSIDASSQFIESNEVNETSSSMEPVNNSLLSSDGDEITNIKNNIKAINDLNGDLNTQTFDELEYRSPTSPQKVSNPVKDLNIEANKKQEDSGSLALIESEVSQEAYINDFENSETTSGSQDSFNNEMSDMEADSFNQQSQQESQEFIQANSLEIKNGNSFRVNNKIQIYKNPVSLNELSNVLAREVTKINPKDTQELTMSLTPGDMGQIELTITKDANNKLEIKMVFSQENALNTVEHKLTELRTILKSRGFEAQIELSKSESASTDNFNRPRQDSYNEAKEEQKEKILHSMPEWLRPDDSDSFQNTLQQII
jgi:hypothetical protein